jgi:xanthine dehydrogenase YagR molybdenum-binding subunit
MIGRAVDRVDGPAKTTGAVPFSTDYPLPGLAYAALTHAIITLGRILAIDAGAAEALPGMLAVITHLNAPAMKPPPKPSTINLASLAPGTSVNYLNTDEVRFNGQPVALVVAESIEAAAEGAALIDIRYQASSATIDFSAGQANAVPQKNTVAQVGSASKGDAEAALAAAPVSVDATYTTPQHQHNAIEPHATTAQWDGDRLTVYDGTQNIDWTRRHLAQRFGVPVGGVRVISRFTGGAFGGKTMVWAGTVLTVLAARVVQRPVRMMLTREGVYRTVGGRTPTVQRVALGAGRDGRLTSLIHTSTAQVGRTGGGPEQVTSVSRDMYAAPNMAIRQSNVTLDAVPNTVMRAPGEATGTFALESAMDELAAALGRDPIELRMLNEPATGPLQGKAFAHRHLREAYAAGAEVFGWRNRAPQPGSMRDGRQLVGMGVASAWHPSWQFQANVTISMSASGQVRVRCGFHEMGMGGATAQAQIAADLLGVPFAAVTVEYGDSELPLGPGAGGSGQTASVAASLLTACGKLKERLLSLAQGSKTSPLRGRRLADLQARDGGLFVGETTTGETYPAILARASRPTVQVAVGSGSLIGSLLDQARFMTKFLSDKRHWIKAACGAQFCEVLVDADTGEIRISRWLGVFDVGTVINAKTAASQLRGAIVMGIGMALSEQTLIDPRTGRIANPSLSEYYIPVHADIPRIDVRYLNHPDPTMPLGLVGVGEVGITGAAAAVANAIYNATGKRIRDLPITLDKLL